MIMIPDTETTLLRGGKMYEEGNEKVLAWFVGQY